MQTTMQTTTPHGRRRKRAPATPLANGEAMAADTAPSPPDPQVARLCANICRLAADHDLSLAELGRRLGMRTGNSFYNLMNGWSGGLSVPTLMKLADLFGVSLDALTGRRAHQAGPDGQGASASALRQAQTIAAALAEAQEALRSAHAAIATAERALQAAATPLPAARAAG